MKLKYEMEMMEIDGSPMAVPVDDGDEFRGVLHMNETTADILEILKNDVTEDEIVAAMKELYDADEAQICHNVEKVLGILCQYGLLA